MALKQWIGTDTGNEGDWATAANWDPSGVPGNGDEVRFNDGAQDVTDGLDQSAITLDSLHIGSGYAGSIAPAASTALQIDIDGRLRVDGRGGRTSIDGEIQSVEVFGGVGSADMLILNGHVHEAHIVGGAGHVTFADAMELNELRIGGVQTGEVVIGENITNLESIISDSGRISLASSADLIRIAGGALMTIEPAASGTAALIEIIGNATLNHLAPGDVTLLRIFGPAALFDGRENIHSGITITRADLYRGGVLDLRNALDGYEITTLKKLGGSLRMWDEFEV